EVLADLEAEERERVEWRLAQQLRGVVAAADQLPGTRALGGAVQAYAVVLGADRGRDEVELLQSAGRRVRRAVPACLDRLLDELGELRPVDVRPGERVRRLLGDR